MASRLYLPSGGAAGASPTISADWEHSSAIRRPMSTTKGSSALTSTAYAPDGADHLVNGDALHVQFVSEPLSAQTISAQTVSISIKGLMAHANNAQFLTWKLFLWTNAGAVGSTLLAVRRDATAYTTALINRTDSATTTSVSVGAGDRLVLEIGTGGTPTAAGGVQGHNATLRWGESGATDAPANDTSTSTTENPWLEFANDLSFVPPPATSATVGIHETASLTAVTVKAGLTAPIARAIAYGQAVGVAVETEVRRRAVVVWAAFSAPVAGGGTTTVRLRGAGRLAATAVRTGTTDAVLRAAGRLTGSGVKASSASVTIRATARPSVVMAKASTSTARATASGSLRSAVVKTGLTSLLARAGGRLTSVGVPSISLGTSDVATVDGRVRLAAVGARASAGLVAVRGRARGLVVAGRTLTALVQGRAAARLALAAVKAARAATTVSTRGHLASLAAKASSATVTLRAGARAAAVGVKAEAGVSTATIAARARLTAPAAKASSTTVIIRSRATSASAFVKGGQTTATIRARPHGATLTQVLAAETVIVMRAGGRGAAISARGTTGLVVIRAASHGLETATTARANSPGFWARLNVQTVGAIATPPARVGFVALPITRLGVVVLATAGAGAATVPTSSSDVERRPVVLAETGRTATARVGVVTTPEDPEG